MSHPKMVATPTAPLTGLSAAEVRERVARGETNHATAITTRSYAQILRENVFTFINNCLFGLGLLLLLLGRPFDALISAGVVLINAVISSAQELQAKRQLDQIALLHRPAALVVRDGQEQHIRPEEVVRGDVLRVGVGDQILVDGAMVGEGRIEVDESQLTGESDLIVKRAGDPVYSGSICVAGGAHYVAEQVGDSSLASQITAGARSYRRLITPLQRDINVLVGVFLLIVAYLEFTLVLNAFLLRRGLVESVEEATVLAGLIPKGLFLLIALGARPGPGARLGTTGRLLRFLIPAGPLSAIFGTIVFYGTISLSLAIGSGREFADALVGRRRQAGRRLAPDDHRRRLLTDLPGHPARAAAPRDLQPGAARPPGDRSGARLFLLRWVWRHDGLERFLSVKFLPADGESRRAV